MMFVIPRNPDPKSKSRWLPQVVEDNITKAQKVGPAVTSLDWTALKAILKETENSHLMYVNSQISHPKTVKNMCDFGLNICLAQLLIGFMETGVLWMKQRPKTHVMRSASHML